VGVVSFAIKMCGIIFKLFFTQSPETHTGQALAVLRNCHQTHRALCCNIDGHVRQEQPINRDPTPLNKAGLEC